MNDEVRVLLFVGLILSTGCIDGGSPERVGGAGDVTVRVVDWAHPVTPEPMSDDALQSVPELRRLFENASRSSDGTAYREVDPGVADRFEDALGDPPTYPGDDRFRPNGTYIRYNGSVVLIRHRRPGPETLVRSYPDAGLAPLNENVTMRLRNVSALHRLVQTAVRRDEPVTEALGDDNDERVEGFLVGLDGYRPTYNAHDNWGAYVRYRNQTYVVSMIRNDTAA